jgi:NAD(P)-dependent dehydrogenase (short-subunit alcohol dehydrogenase family)
VVVITGASAGIGRASARAFAARGDSIALIARGTRGLQAAREELTALGARAASFPVDVADADALDAVAGRIEEELGPIDVWVNVAFTSVFARFVDITAAEYERVTSVSYLGYVNGTRSALRRMLPRDR